MISRSAPASAASAATSSMPGVSTTGSNSLGTVLVAGRNRVPNPAAGTTAVRGIGTRGRVIVHTLTSLAWLNLARSTLRRLCGACDGLSSWTPWRTRRRPSCGPRSCWPAARWRRRCTTPRPHALCGHLPALVGDGETVCAYVPVGSEPGSIELIDSLLRRGVRVLLPVARHDARRHCRCRCSGASTAPAAWSRRGSGCASPPSRGCPPTRSRPPRWSWCPRSRSTAPGCGWAAARASTTARCRWPTPAARLVAVVRDDELVDRLPAEPHDVRMTHALTPNGGLVALG